MFFLRRNFVSGLPGTPKPQKTNKPEKNFKTDFFLKKT